MRVGAVAKKLGMTRIFTDSGEHIPVTVLELDNCQVVGHKQTARDGYDALQIGIGRRSQNKLRKPQRGQFAKARVEPKQKVHEFRITTDNFIDVGAVIKADHFVTGQHVDATGISIGKGFAGVIKRHNFAMQRASHGVSKTHRAHGSTGNCEFPGRVFKGKRMAGHMGAKQVTTQNLVVVATDNDNSLVMVKGAVPGSKGSWIILKDAVKRNLPQDVPVPGSFSVSADLKNNAETKVTAGEAVKQDAKNKDEV